jgi:single-strand DNA-binding protein
MFNNITLVGNLTRDIELRPTQGGSVIATSSIATSRKYSVNGEKKEDVCFVDLTFFGRSAEVANQYLHKGSKILANGRLNFDQWVDQSGQKRSKHSVVVETMQMLDSKSSASAPQQQQQAPEYHYENIPNSAPPQQREMPQQPPVIDVDEDEIPFNEAR